MLVSLLKSFTEKKISPSNPTEAFEDNVLERRRSNPYNHWVVVLVTLLIFYYTYNSTFFMSYSPRKRSPMKETPKIVQATTTAKTIRTSTYYLATVDDLNEMKKKIGKIYMTGNSIVFREKNNLKMINTSYSFGFNQREKNEKLNNASTSFVIERSKSKVICAYNHTSLSPVKVNKTNLKLEWVDKQYPEVRTGGHYSPPHCHSRHKVAIIVPYRSRQEHLSTFLFNIHPFLIKQQIEYKIFVVEQAGFDVHIELKFGLQPPGSEHWTFVQDVFDCLIDVWGASAAWVVPTFEAVKVGSPGRRYPFNKGRLYNAAFIEVQKLAQWKCFIFHDVDLLPLDRRILYTCPTWPRHMCATVLGLKRDSPRYRTIFGGVTALTAEQYTKVNGYSNTYWSWGGEDNDMFWRLKMNGYGVVRYNKTIAQYTMLSHRQTPKNKYRYALLKSAGVRCKKEGLSSVNYKLLHTEDHHLYTHYLVDVNPYRENITQTTIAWINTYVTFGLGRSV